MSMDVDAEAGESAPRGKAPMPPLEVRAPRPAVVRVRKRLVIAAGVVSAAVVSGALGWAFIIEPDLRARARQDAGQPVEEGPGRVRPNPQIAERPANYGDLRQSAQRLPDSSAELPEPAVSASPNGSRSDRARAAPIRAADEAAHRAPMFLQQSPHAGPPNRSSASLDQVEARQSDHHRSQAHQLVAPIGPYELKAGSIIPALLLTAADSTRPGPVMATVTDNLYDTVSGQHLIIPQGARLIGRHDGESRYGDKRVFLSWDRLILPNGKSLALNQEPGVDGQGAVGVEGRVERRLLPLVTATLFAGAITALGQIARDDSGQSRGWLGDAGDAAAIEAAQVGGRMVDRELGVRPSVRLPSGARVRVLLTRDLVLEPYQR